MPSWGDHGASWWRHGAILGRLEGLLGRLWGVLGATWGLLAGQYHQERCHAVLWRPRGAVLASLLRGFGTQDASKTPPRRPKMPPKTPRRGKTPPRRPKTPPRRAQDAPKTPQRRPKRPQEVPRRPPRPSQIHPKSILMLKTLKIKKTLQNQWKINDFQGLGAHFSE